MVVGTFEQLFALEKFPTFTGTEQKLVLLFEVREGSPNPQQSVKNPGWGEVGDVKPIVA